ncbi:MAG TPA: NADP-dependent oxidoreductase [Steroidobacteraceae bacterium]|nr:NADP-dependent oxidoreductase [Steroidobacteraceae bacterium]HRX88459.1 NADP-dependent oxidoreductase [Steroidobacteraceae bacterium]
MSKTNQRITFARSPQGLPTPEDFGADTVAIPKPTEGQFLSRTIYLSLDPYYRNVMKNSQIYQDRLAPGDVMVGETVAQIVESRHADFKSGDYVAVRNGWQQYALSSGQGVRKLDASVAPISTALGVLGMPGLTGFAGTVSLGEPKPGDTFVVSAATGPVGSTAGQTARLMGARVVGIAGSKEKCDYAVRELGFAACVNYKVGDLATNLKAACPNGIDVYFDNVAGDTLVAVLRNLAMGARIVLCGMIEAYSMDKPPAGPFLGPVVGARATMKGLVVYDHLAMQPRLTTVVGGWIKSGQFKYREDITEGLAQAPQAFCDLMRGKNFGKALVRVGPEKL